MEPEGKVTDEESTAYREGARAFDRHLRYNEEPVNPYPEGSPEHKLWRRGYYDTYDGYYAV
jgi:hypothetical protein